MDLELKQWPLRFPRGVRLARLDEIPGKEIAVGDAAAIKTGFLSKPSNQDGFAVFIEANVHADELWVLFKKLASLLLPDVAAPLIGWKDEEPILGPYTDTQAALNVLEPYADSLQHDGYIEFGLMFQHCGKTEEIFVKAAKYLQIWTNHPASVEAILRDSGIQSVQALKFVDEWPRITERLKDAPTSNDVIEAVKNSFATLPSR